MVINIKNRIRRLILKLIFFLQKILMQYNIVFTYSLHFMEKGKGSII